jgi:hypothetical protein
MRRWLVVALVTALGAASALAQGKGPLAKPAWVKASPPKGWNELPGLARSVSTTLEQSHSFGDLRGRAGAQAFAEPGTGAFYVSWLVADRAAPDKAQALRGALDAVRHSRIAASPEASSTEELAYKESVTDNMAEAMLEWRHLSNETLSLVRAFAWVSPAGAPRLLKGECVVSTTDGKAPPAVESACREALAALSAAVPPGERGALGDLPAGAPAPAPAPDQVEAVESPAAGTPADQAKPDTVGSAPTGDQKILYAGPPKESKGDSMSKWFVLLGGALLVAGLYLTYRARARSAVSAPAAAGASASASDDADADSDPEPGREPEKDADSEKVAGSDEDAGSPAPAASEEDASEEDKA